MALFKRSSISVHDAWERAQDGALIVDVRNRAELSGGMAKGAIHAPLPSLEKRMRPMEGKDVLVICRSGNRSATATRILRGHGIEATNVRGGMLAWDRAGLPTQRKKR